MLDQVIPVFCIASISHDLLNKFFNTANDSEYITEAGGPRGILINIFNIPSLTTPTTSPVPPQQTYPFLGSSIEEVIEFARRNFSPEQVSNLNMIVLDEQTAKDEETCLCLSSEGVDEHRRFKAEFGTSIALLNNLEMGVGGQDMVDVNMEQDGVARF